MPAYHKFAEVYDEVMSGVDYEGWANYVEQLLRRHHCQPQKVLDLACGTGNTSLPMAKRGYQVSGVDGSASMLAVAREKVKEAGLDIPFYQQDLRELHLAEKHDLALCLYDSLNYILEGEDLELVFRRVKEAVPEGGLFIFDMNSYYRLSHLNSGASLIEREGLVLFWNNEYIPDPGIWQITLTGFLKRGGLWERFDEVHQERAYLTEEIIQRLRGAGWQLEAAYTAYTVFPVQETTARIYFVARKPEGEGSLNETARR